MADLIDRQAFDSVLNTAQEILKSGDDTQWELNQKYFKGLAWARRLLAEQPTAEPKCGEWIRVRVGPYQHTYGMRCSRCDATYMLSFECEEYFKAKAESTHYCSNCGAKMNIRSNNNESYN